MARRRSSRRLNESPRAVSLKRILRHRHRHRQRSLLPLLLRCRRRRHHPFRRCCRCRRGLRNLGSHGERPAVLTKTFKAHPKNLRENRPYYKYWACCGLTSLPLFLPTPPKLPSAFLPLYPRDRNSLTHRLYIYRRNKFQVRFQTVDAKRQTWNSHARVRITLLLYRGLVNKLNQIRSALALVTGVVCVC